MPNKKNKLVSIESGLPPKHNKAETQCFKTKDILAVTSHRKKKKNTSQVGFVVRSGHWDLAAGSLALGPKGPSDPTLVMPHWQVDGTSSENN